MPSGEECAAGEFSGSFSAETALSGLCVSGAPGEEARAAKDGPTLRRVEGHGGLLTALRAVDRDLDALAHAGRLRGRDGREPFVLGLLAWLAALGLVLQTFVMEKDLLTRSPDEFFAAINAAYRAVLEFNFFLTPFLVSLFRSCVYL